MQTEETAFRNPFELQVGDRVKQHAGTVGIVTELGNLPRTLGGILAYREGARPAPEAGDAFSVMFDNGKGISGRWDGESGFEVIL